ncbi:MAG TPA: AsmA-like C-terminal domain-containing protein [Candidatus Hydrogenedentes bacterium]|nr:AsmA-like C-terminal domain-containing protein [Candidatus Hydrogenedentota bacterium]HRT21618.1 AsmA-like C-terminal domain-containing protein [Candidatus Hydrogenedentota bacterium]HRT63241.1 AsmA-like C-terminal domain-containing protein [Candidatus Hydrogenedentota bacterium]
MVANLDIAAAIRRRRYAIVVLVLAALVALGVMAATRFADIERYRPEIVASLERATGMPVSVGRMRLRLFPVPGIGIDDIAVGDAECRLLIRRATASLRLAGLTQGRIAIEGITLSDVSLVLPKDLSVLRNIAERFKKPDRKSASLPSLLDIERFHIRQGEIRHGIGGTVWATFDGTAHSLTAETVPLRLTANLPAWGRDAKLLIEGKLTPHNGLGGQGKISLKGIDLTRLAERPEWTGGQAEATISINAPNIRRVSAEIHGAVHNTPLDVLNGTLSALAWWQENALTINDIEWASSGTSLAADLTWEPSAQVACRIVEARADSEAMAALAAVSSETTICLKPRKDAECALKDVIFGLNTEREIRVAKGFASLNGLDVYSRDGRRLLTDVHADLTAEDDVFRINELAADALQLTGTLRVNWAEKSVVCEASGTATLLPSWLALAPPSFPIADIKGVCKLETISATIRAGQGFPGDFNAEGALDNIGFTIAGPPLVQPLPVEGLKGRFAFKEGQITVENISANGIVVSGSMVPRKGAIALDLHGKAAIDQAPIGAFLPKDLISGLGGTLTLERFKATLGSKGLPADLDMAAGIEDGRLTLETAGFKEKLSNITAQANVDAKGFRFDLETRSERAGTLTLRGGYDTGKKRLVGTLVMDLAQCVGSFLGTLPSRESWLALAQHFGLSTFQIESTWPPEKNEMVPVQITREGAPPCQVKINLSKHEGKWQVGELDASLEIPLAPLKPVFPKAMEADGSVILRAQKSKADPQWTLEADLDDVDAVFGDYLYKKRGDPLHVKAMPNLQGGMKLDAFHVQYGGLDIPVRIRDGGAYVDNITLDLAGLAGLLPQHGTIHGRVRGSFGSKPLAATLELEDAGAFIAPDLGIDKVSGTVTVHGKRVVLKDVRARGLDSDCTFNAELIDGVFHGSANGSRLNLNDVIYFVDHLPDYKRSPKPTDEKKPRSPTPFACELQVSLDTLIYRKAGAQNVTGVFSMRDEIIHAANIAGIPNTGRLTGSIEVYPSRGGQRGHVNLDLEAKEADLRFVDAIVFDKPRGLAGIVTGKVTMIIPTGSGTEAMDGANGGFSLEAHNGSLGDVAFATPLRNLLKTTTLIRLRLPEYGTDALDFDRCRAAVIIEDGVWTLQQADMENPYLSMIAEGWVDFPRRSTDVRLRINFLESVTGLLSKVPLVGTVVSRVGGMTGMDLQVYDSPYDMKVRLRPTQRLENAGKAAGEVMDTLTRPFRRKE